MKWRKKNRKHKRKCNLIASTSEIVSYMVRETLTSFQIVKTRRKNCISGFNIQIKYGKYKKEKKNNEEFVLKISHDIECC